MENNSASHLIREHLRLFGRSMVEAAIPSPVDGLKQVHRRILISVREFAELVLSQAMIAQTSVLHPHGDHSIYHAAVRLAQSFEYNPEPMQLRGSSGTYAEPNPAALRYTKMALSEFGREIFFRRPEEYRALPKTLGVLQVDYEPIYLAPALPTALLYANNTIGYGFSSYTVPHNLTDVCDLVIAFTQHKKQHPTLPFDYAKYAEKFLPDFPVFGTLTNHQELLAAYRLGDFTHTIRLDGEVHLTADSITIKTLPYGTPFEPLVGNIEDLLRQKNSWFDVNIVSVKQLSNKKLIGGVCVKIKRGVSVFEAWEVLRKKISFSGTLTPIPNYNEDGYVVSMSQPLLLDFWYGVRYNVLVASKKMRITNLTVQIRRVEALLIICDNVDDVVSIIRSNDRPTCVQRLQERFDLTHMQAEYLGSAQFFTLSTTSKSELQQRLESLNKDLREVRDSFATIPEEMAAEALAIKKRYPSPRRTKIPNYLGYVRIGGGCIQIESIDEIAAILEDFPKVEMEIYMYDGPNLYKVNQDNKLERGQIPKITTGDIYGLKTNQVVTVNITDGTACSVRGFVPGMRKEGYFYTTQKSKAIYRNGEIRSIDVTVDISLRKTICRGASTNIIYVYPEIKQDHYVIALNTATPNVIVIQRVAADRSKIAMNPTGEVHVVHSVRKHLFLNIPQQFLNRNTTRVVEFVDLDKLVGDNNQAYLNIAEAKIKTNKLINLL